MMPARLGLAVALAALTIDQASKLYLLFEYDLGAHEPVHLTSFATLLVVWNRGISYGLFQQHSEIGRWLLIGLSALATLAMGWWMLRARQRILAASLGLVVGGAVGNGIDRVAYGAVFDFIHLHYGSFSWYVFNVADAAIVAGVVGLVYDAFLGDRHRQPAA
ncbi:signal peptidase II [uncultured Enterovirga sp.]|uniref:signal peptidase II n=1 Tax=uncultured Enterovirga sp. TaxID=2026352 RepID=UPI0035CBE33E